jgi:hypothetical protein
MPTVSPCLIRSVGSAGDPGVSLGVRLLDEYLEFLSGRCRPNTVLAVAYDLKVFFTVVGKSPKRVRPADVLAFMTAQRTGHGSAAQTVQPVECRLVGAHLIGTARVEERDQDVGEHVAGEQDATVREEDRGVADGVRLMLDHRARHGSAVRGQRVTSPISSRGTPEALSALLQTHAL